MQVPESDPRFVYVQSVPAYIKSSDLWELFDDCGYAPLDLRRKLERGTGVSLDDCSVVSLRQSEFLLHLHP